MTVPSVAVDEAVLASTVNQLVAHVNNGHGRAVFTANGNWVVPAGVHQFRVYLCGGGAKGSDATISGGESPILTPGFKGGRSPLASAVFSGQAVGASFTITIGQGSSTTAQGGTTSFGALMQVTGGLYSDAHRGDVGAASFPPGAPQVYHDNSMFGFYGTNQAGEDEFVPYGEGGAGGILGQPTGLEGADGVCIVEW